MKGTNTASYLCLYVWFSILWFITLCFEVFCDENYPDNDIEWCEPIYTWDSPQQCVDLILSRNIDLLIVPMYVWTELRNTDVCLGAKKEKQLYQT